MRLNEGLEVLGTDEYPGGEDWCGVFHGSALESVELPSTLRRIEYSAFAYCARLKHIRLPEGLEVIGKAAFVGSGLEEVVFPSSVRRVCPYAFYECGWLRSAVLNERL